MKVQRSIEIDRPPEEVFAYLCDFNRAREWREWVRVSNQTPAGGMVVGSELYEAIARLMGLEP